MKAISLLYHDIVDSGDFDSSGFLWPGAARYKLDIDEFEDHVEMIDRSIRQPPAIVSDHLESANGVTPLFLTFDDGGSSAVKIADILERKNWFGHFFVSTDFVDQPTFLKKKDIRDLDGRGHVIGSHSSSHPKRMASCSREKLLHEWRDSRSKLSDFLGKPVLPASSPGGYFSQEVAETAAEAGFSAIFTSEPVLDCRRVRSCLVLGRFTVRRGMSGRFSARLAAGDRFARLHQISTWKLKKSIKALFGRYWFRIRGKILR